MENISNEQSKDLSITVYLKQKLFVMEVVEFQEKFAVVKATVSWIVIIVGIVVQIVISLFIFVFGPMICRLKKKVVVVAAITDNQEGTNYDL